MHNKACSCCTPCKCVRGLMDLFWQTRWQPGDSNLKTYTPSPSLAPCIYLQPGHLNALAYPNLPCSSAGLETSPYFTGYGILGSEKGCELICETGTSEGFLSVRDAVFGYKLQREVAFSTEAQKKRSHGDSSSKSRALSDKTVRQKQDTDKKTQLKQNQRKAQKL